MAYLRKAELSKMYDKYWAENELKTYQLNKDGARTLVKTEKSKAIKTKTGRTITYKTTHKIDYKAYINSEAWKEKRKQVLIRSNGCYVCETKNKIIHVHHKTYKRLGSENLEDLVALCEDCHNKLHKKGLNIKTGVKILRRRFLKKKKKKKVKPTHQRISPKAENLDAQFDLAVSLDRV